MIAYISKEIHTSKASTVLPLFHKTKTTIRNAEKERTRSGIMATATISTCKTPFNTATSLN